MGEGSKKLQWEGERGRTVRSGEITEGIRCFGDSKVRGR